MPAHAPALPVAGAGPLRVRSPEVLVRELWDAIADVMVRTAAATPTPALAAKSTFGLQDLLQFQWQVTVGGEVLTDEEVAAPDG